MFHVMFWICETKKCFSGVPSNDLSRYDPLSGYVWAKSESREGQSAALIKYLHATELRISRHSMSLDCQAGISQSALPTPTTWHIGIGSYFNPANPSRTDAHIARKHRISGCGS
ncbi:Beta-lactamase-like protein sdnR [Fusarium oxysporum f. sp. albedinis]|nr:Beta-lactamase-like protein sdnR [Fusarium oxysporum f. sp. albedinis]